MLYVYLFKKKYFRHKIAEIIAAIIIFGTDLAEVGQYVKRLVSKQP